MTSRNCRSTLEAFPLLLDHSKNFSTIPQENIDSKSLILSRLKELEEETGEPERRDNQRRRKKQVKDIQTFLQDNSKSSEEKIEFLQQKILSQVRRQGADQEHHCHLQDTEVQR